MRKSASAAMENSKELLLEHISINKEIAELKDEINKLNAKYSSVKSLIRNRDEE